MEVKFVTIAIDELDRMISRAVEVAVEAGISKFKESIDKEPESKYMTIVEAAEYLNVSRMTVHRYCKAGDLKKYRMPNGQPRLLREDVKNYCTRLSNTK